ncbi:MAG: efflux RND transporter permease subunit [Candidatus Omnitrophica bacterium]|nr:efflux RND transporter permease subunit [Candidatus Omnitrophota bacterium]
MRLPEFSVRKPVTVTMIFLGVALLGYISWTRLPQALFPAITYPQITVVTVYENAAPEEVEILITKVIEEVVGTVPNLKRISSISKEGLSTIILEFNWGTNMDLASLAVREKIDLIKERLPLGAQDPIVMKYNPFELPVVILSVTGPISPLELREVCRKVIKDEIEKIEGVASANITGGWEREIIVEVDQGRLSANGIPILRIVNALKETNFSFPAGTIKETFFEYLIRTMGEFERVNEVKSVVIEAMEPNPPKTRYEMFLQEREKKEKDRRLISLSDLATVRDAWKEQTSISRYNGKDNVTVSVMKQADANVVLTARKVREVLEKIKDRIPKQLNVEVIYDQSEFIRASIQDLKTNAWQGGVLAFLVLLLFLREFRSSLIISLSIPVSIMAALCMMYFQGISINMMSLGGLALGVGMIVDNSIVVLENIYRYRKQYGKGFREAVILGATEMGSAITGSTLTTVVVFVPLIYVVGIAGQLFREMALTITYSLLISLVVALTLVPRLAAIGSEKKEIEISKEVRKKEPKFFLKIGNAYARLIAIFLKFRFIGLFLIGLVFILSIGMLAKSDRELLPKIDERQFVLKLEMQTGTKLEVTDRICREVEKALLSIPDIEGVSLAIGSTREERTGEVVETMGSHQARFVVNLKKVNRRDPGYRSTQEIINVFQEELAHANLEGARLEYILQESVFKMAFQAGKPISLEIKGHDLKTLEAISKDMEKMLQGISGVYGVTSSLAPPHPETKVNVLKDKAAYYNLSVNDIAMSAQVAIKGHVATKFKEMGQEYDIRVRLREEDRNEMNKLRQILIHSNALDVDIPLSDVAYIVSGTGPSQIERLDQQRVIVLSANIYKRGFDKVAKDIESALSRYRIPEGFTIKLGGERKDMEESFKSLRFALILSLILNYMVMASEFESLWQPFIIMFNLPLSIIGVALAIFFTRTTLNSVVILGTIMLGGIVVNNGIVLIETINSLRKEGMVVEKALIQAGLQRVRPIMMTSLTTILGLLPLALGLGEGAELRAPMAITVIGGLLSGTFLTLLVIPALYLIVFRFFALFRKKEVLVEIEPPEIIHEGVKPIPVEITPEVKILPEKETVPQISGIPFAEEKLPLVEEEKLGGLNERQKKFLAELKTKIRLTRKDYIKLFNVSMPTAARDIKILVEKGFIRAKGPAGPGRWYELT